MLLVYVAAAADDDDVIVVVVVVVVFVFVPPLPFIASVYLGKVDAVSGGRWLSWWRRRFAHDYVIISPSSQIVFVSPVAVEC